jgi:hypothetical protein
MSLKAVHLVFVTALSALTFGCGIWLLKDYAAAPDNKTQLVPGCLALAAGVVVIIYGKYFLKKMRGVSYL